MFWGGGGVYVVAGRDFCLFYERNKSLLSVANRAMAVAKKLATSTRIHHKLKAKPSHKSHQIICLCFQLLQAVPGRSPAQSTRLFRNETSCIISSARQLSQQSGERNLIRCQQLHTFQSRPNRREENEKSIAYFYGQRFDIVLKMCCILLCAGQNYIQIALAIDRWPLAALV